MSYGMTKKINALTLLLLITGSIDNIRNLPATASFGYSLIFFIGLGALLFLIPCALVAAELSAQCPKDSGIYEWIKAAFGKKWAFFAVWLQWVNTIVWFPTILSFIAGNLVYLINPAWVNHKGYLLLAILGIFWCNTVLSLKGIHFSSKFTNVCAVVGVIVPLVCMIGLGFYWKIIAPTPPTVLTPFLPVLSDVTSWTVLTAIITSFLGIELACVHAKDINNPGRIFPIVLIIATALIIVTMTLASLGLAFLVPQQNISLITGVMQAFDRFFQYYPIPYALPTLLALIILGNMGGLVNWMIAPLKGLAQGIHDGFLPRCLLGNNGGYNRLLIIQGGLTSIMSTMFLLSPTLNLSYWWLSALSTNIYILMYGGMFLAAIKLRKKGNPPAFTVPGGRLGLIGISTLGLIGCTLTFIIGFLPPKGYTPLGYSLIFFLGFCGLCLPGLFIIRYSKHSPLAT
jgi:amino acid transporter